MNLNHLEYFLEIVNCDSITKASKKLYLSPTTLVSAINALENELGYKLLIRSHRGVTPTTAGKIVYDDLLKIFKMTRSWFFLDKINHATENVTIRVVPSVYESVCSKLSVDMLENYPDIFLDMTPLYSRNFEKEFFENHLSLAIGSYHKSNKSSVEVFAQNFNLNLDILFEDHYVVYYSSANKFFENKSSISLEEYNSLESISFLSQKTFECEMNSFFTKLLPIYTFEQLFEYLSNHNCVTILPSILQKHIICSSGKIHTCPFSDNTIKIWFYLLSHQENKLTVSEKKVQDYIKFYFSKNFTP